jgi:beta-N-acetylhexosaminidase
VIPDGENLLPAPISDIHRKLCPFLVTGLAGARLTDAEREILSQAPPAGVIFFHRNVRSAAQLRRLAGEVCRIVEEASGMTPLIMADHEGGRVSVLCGAVGVPPSQMAAWRPRSVEILARIVAGISRDIRSCGVNLTLSPVADVNCEPLNPVIGTRSFGEDAEEVSAAVRIAVKAMAGEGLLSCLKHFPGHGATGFDSHTTLPVTGRTMDQLREVELPPFAAGIEEGADAVMTAHIALGDGDPPASLDRDLVTGLLRDGLGFGGVIITDALEMAGALPDRLAMRSLDPGSGKEASSGAVPAAIAVRALAAGNDLLLMSRDLEEVYTELALHSASLVDGLSNSIPAGQLEGSAARIASLRERAVAPDDPPIAAWRSGDGDLERASLMEWILPAEGGSGTEGEGKGAIEGVVPVFIGTEADFGSHAVGSFMDRVMRRLGGEGWTPGSADLVPVGAAGGPETGLYIFERAGSPEGKRVLFLLCRKPPPAGIIHDIASRHDLIVVAGRPWDAGLLPEGKPAIVTYGICDAAAERTADIIRRRL